MMAFSALNTLLLILISISFFGLSKTEIIYNEVGEQREFVSGGDDNVGGEMSSKILTNFRFLLGLHSPKSSGQKHSLSPAPSPTAEERLTTAPSPLRFHSHHVHTSSPFTHKGHSPSPRYSNGGRRDERARIRKVVIAVAVSAGSVFAVIFSAAVYLVCKSCRRRRNRTSLNCTNKVSFDPDTGPELFYLNSLANIIDIESSCKLSSRNSKNVLSNESLPSFNASHDDEGIHRTSSSSRSCESEKVLLNEDMPSSNDQLYDGDTSATYLDEEILVLTSDDGSFHSVCNSSCGSIASELSLSCASGKCSTFNSSNGSISPNIMLARSPLFAPPPPPPPPPTWMTFTHTSPLNSKTKLSPKSPATSRQTPPISSIIGNAKIWRQPTPPIPSQGNKSIPKPPPPPIASHSNGSIPRPPPPPLPTFRPPSLQIGSNSRQPLPPPPCQFQQSTPVGKDGTPLPKLKPLHWDKVRAAPNRSTVWDRIKSSSFELDEQMMESLFSYNTQCWAKTEEAKAKSSSPGKHVLDNKRLQNITILLKAVNATSEQVCEALIQGRGLSTQQLEALAKMVPTKEEEDKFFNYSGVTKELDLSEIFVKAILTIPFAFSRIQVMLFKETFEDEVVHLNKSFAMLEEACKELRSSRLFFRLLEAVLKTGNRMNVGTIRGGARAFKLDTLLKLADVKGTDGKTTLLHFVIQEIIRSEGVAAMENSINKNKPKTDEEREEGYRVMGLNIVSGLSTELCNVKKTASIDLDVLASSVANLTEGMNQTKHLVEVDLTNGGSERNKSFVNSMKTFLISAERTIKELKENENRVLVHVKEITEYYHGDVSKDEANPLRIFVIVRNFLTMLDCVCKEVRSLKGSNPAMPSR